MPRKRYRFLATSLRTGRVTMELPLVNVSAQCRLGGGAFSGQLPLHGRPLQRCREFLSAVEPGEAGVVVVRDNKVMGEWMLWTQPNRSNGPEPVALGGTELVSWFDHVAVDGFANVTNIDRIQLAASLVQHALDRAPGIAITLETPGNSGTTVSAASYPTGSDYVGTIVTQLANSVNGFDFYTDSDFDNSSTTPAMKRTARLQYPRRGRSLSTSINIPRRVAGKTGVLFSGQRDGTRIATTVYMTGNGSGGKQLFSRGLNADLVNYPPLNFIDANSDYDVQATLDAAAAGVAASMRTPDLPTTVRLRADGDLPLGSYIAGDSLRLRVEECENYPNGIDTQVRIVGFTMTPPAAGQTEFVDVEIEGDNGGFTL